MIEDILLAVASSLKVRVHSLGYGCGLCAGDIVRLKVKHIDSVQKIIRIEQSRGRVAAMVEGASVTARCGNSRAGMLAISQQNRTPLDLPLGIVETG